MSRWLVISDLQIPFEAPGALDFCRRVQKDLKIQSDHILCVGDEVDNYYGSDYDHDPNAEHTARQELAETQEKLKAWVKAFPFMRLAVSNHGERWAKKASRAGMLAEYVRPYQEVLGLPKTWRWADRWLVNAKHPWQLIHGLGYSSMYAYRHIPLDAGISTAFGHLHSSAGVAHITTATGTRWGMNCGSLIKPEAYAFKYGSDMRFKPVLSIGAVVDDGLTPLLFRYEG
jgi:hypothetical protein